MHTCSYCGKKHDVGFISTRLAGTDGVSLEPKNGRMFLKVKGLNVSILQVSLTARRSVHTWLKKPILNIRI